MGRARRRLAAQQISPRGQSFTEQAAAPASARRNRSKRGTQRPRPSGSDLLLFKNVGVRRAAGIRDQRSIGTSQSICRAGVAGGDGLSCGRPPAGKLGEGRGKQARVSIVPPFVGGNFAVTLAEWRAPLHGVVRGWRDRGAPPVVVMRPHHVLALRLRQQTAALSGFFARFVSSAGFGAATGSRFRWRCPSTASAQSLGSTMFSAM